MVAHMQLTCPSDVINDCAYATNSAVPPPCEPCCPSDVIKKLHMQPTLLCHHPVSMPCRHLLLFMAKWLSSYEWYSDALRSPPQLILCRMLMTAKLCCFRVGSDSLSKGAFRDKNVRHNRPQEASSERFKGDKWNGVQAHGCSSKHSQKPNNVIQKSKDTKTSGEKVHLLHILKKHVNSRNPSWRGTTLAITHQKNDAHWELKALSSIIHECSTLKRCKHSW